MKRLIKLVIVVLLLLAGFLIYDYWSITTPKNVKFQELDDFKSEVLNEFAVDEVEIYFSRPSLFIEINSKEKLNDEDVEAIKEKLKPIINRENMDKISQKYWTKDSSLYYVYVLFNKYDGVEKYNYINIELNRNKRYNNWYD